VKARLPVFYLVTKDDDRSSRALSRIASVALTPADLGDNPVGPGLVDVIVRSVREDK
jgi:hypothetical protein